MKKRSHTTKRRWGRDLRAFLTSAAEFKHCVKLFCLYKRIWPLFTHNKERTISYVPRGLVQTIKPFTYSPIHMISACSSSQVSALCLLWPVLPKAYTCSPWVTIWALMNPFPVKFIRSRVSHCSQLQGAKRACSSSVCCSCSPPPHLRYMHTLHNIDLQTQIHIYKPPPPPQQTQRRAVQILWEHHTRSSLMNTCVIWLCSLISDAIRQWRCWERWGFLIHGHRR